MIDETRIVRNIEAVIRKIKESKSWKIEYCRTKDVVLMFETILDTIAESKVEQPTIQPQGIDKDRLIKFLKEEQDEWKCLCGARSAGCGSSAIEDVLTWVNHQPTSDGWIPVSERLPKESDYYEVTVKFDEELPPFKSNVYYSVTDRGWSTYRPYVVAWREHLPQPYKESEEE